MLTCKEQCYHVRANAMNFELIESVDSICSRFFAQPNISRLAKALTLVLAQKQFVPQCKDFPTQDEWSTLQLKNYRMVHAMASCTADFPDLVADRKLTGVCDSDAQHVTWYLNRSQEFMKPLQLDWILQIEINKENLSKLLHICSYLTFGIVFADSISSVQRTYQT